MRTALLPLFFLLASVQAATVEQTNELEKILRKLEKRYQTSETIYCSFKQIQTISQLEGDVRLNGKMYFRKPHFFRLEMRGDENLNLFVDGEKVWLENLDFQEVETYSYADIKNRGRITRLLPPVFINSLDEMRQLYRAELLQPRQGRSTIRFKPKNAEQSMLLHIQFTVDDLARIRWLEVLYRNNDRTETRFSNWKRLQSIAEVFFRYRKK